MTLNKIFGMVLRNRFFLLLCFCSFGFTSFSQTETKPVKVAVFAPVYLDSVFSNEIYKPGKNNLPKYLLAGLDFYHGVAMAADTLNAEHSAIEVLFYDSKSTQNPIGKLVTDSLFQDVSMIIASFNSRTEIKPLANFALAKNIPLISATYPNAGGITENPFFVLQNPTLSAHIEAIYRFMHRYYPLEPITVFRKKGVMEDVIQSEISGLNTKTPGLPLKLKTVELPDNFTTEQVFSYLDSTRQNIVFCGSLDENFGLALSRALSSSFVYKSIAIGMPTWDGLRDISRNLEVVYSSPYQHNTVDNLRLRLTEKYKSLYAGLPSDMFFKGYESMYHFTKLLLKYGNEVITHLSDKSYRVFNDFQFEPVIVRGNGASTDYLENKKLYFIRMKDGLIKSVN